MFATLYLIGLLVAIPSIPASQKSSKTKKSTYFFTCIAGNLNSLSVPAMGHLPVCFPKMLMPGGRPGGGGWALLEMTDA